MPDWTQFDQTLLWGAVAFAVIGAICAGALLFNFTPILGMHPATKPLKFAVSIGLFLGSLSILLPAVSLDPSARRIFVWLFLGSMIVEMTPIVIQSVRGKTSHFNIASPFDAVLWKAMTGAIVVATLSMMALAVFASVRPLTDPDGLALHPLSTAAWRLGLWFFPLAAVSGFAMGGRLSHSVGGSDGGPGLPFLNWSTLHGDLRVSHFFALHALQFLPLAAWVLLRTPLADGLRWAVFLGGVALQLAVTLWTLARAFAGRPF